MQPIDKKRNQKMSREQQKTHKKNMALPQNKFLNAVDDEGKIKYPIAIKLRKYYISNPDPVLDDLRLANAYLAQVRWSISQAKKYLKNYEGKEAITVRDKHGDIMERDDCYNSYIASEQNIYLVLSKLREHLSSTLLAKCEKDFFSLDQYDEFVGKIDKIVAELGFELFPSEIKLIEPL